MTGRTCIQLPHKRFEALDRLRGLVMILMALDHVSYFILRTHYSEYWGSPFPGYPSAAAFFTRIFSHVCAPAFFFLMGVSVALFAAARALDGWTGFKIDCRLGLRGLVFMALDLFVFNFLWNIGSNRGVHGASNMPGSGPMVSPVLFGVIFALGLCMLLSVLIRRLPLWILVVGGIAAIIGSFFLVDSVAASKTRFSLIIRLLLLPGRTDSLIVLYPVFPWLGIMALGIGFGKALRTEAPGTYTFALWAGLLMLAVFAALRLGFGLGDFHMPPSRNPQGYFTLTKYPPSIDYILLFLGVALVLLYVLAKTPQKLPFLEVFGRVPFFFYTLHLCVYCALGGIVYSSRITYDGACIFWIGSIALFYPICLLYGKWKQKQSPASIFRIL